MLVYVGSHKNIQKKQSRAQGSREMVKWKPEIQRKLELVVTLVICFLQNIMTLRQIVYSNEIYFINQLNRLKLHQH